MKKSQLIFALSCATLTASQLSGQTQCPGNISTVQYHSFGNSQITIPVMINHAGPYDFLLDTGAQISIVEPSLAEELQLKSLGEINVISMASNAAAHLVELDVLEVGSAAVPKQMAAVQSMAQLQRVNPKIRGLLGGNFLAHFDLLLDYGHKLLCLDDSGQLRQSIQGEHVPMTQLNVSPSASSIPAPILIAARLPGDRSRSTILKLDSGTNAPVLFSAPLEMPIASTLGSQAQRGSVTGGSAQYFVALPVKDVQIGTHTWVAVKFVAPINNNEATGRTGMDGLLPTQLFKRILISYAARYVIFNPR